jgi:hypothetical protein
MLCVYVFNKSPEATVRRYVSDYVCVCVCMREVESRQNVNYKMNMMTPKYNVRVYVTLYECENTFVVVFDDTIYRNQ